ncbi:hypothetical protein SAMN04515678_1111 [Roseivivax sediminis]|uniref:Uncharacterized protein n=1 Tax=Roseivivax sediminis TaxID=936889 RepID=A0A1I2BDG6_9RHOB|nr:hypothetical protein SAMN04515678_1111 [Roseivivax sediminis]
MLDPAAKAGKLRGKSIFPCRTGPRLDRTILRIKERDRVGLLVNVKRGDSAAAMKRVMRDALLTMLNLPRLKNPSIAARKRNAVQHSIFGSDRWG